MGSPSIKNGLVLKRLMWSYESEFKVADIEYKVSIPPHLLITLQTYNP